MESGQWSYIMLAKETYCFNTLTTFASYVQAEYAMAPPLPFSR